MLDNNAATGDKIPAEANITNQATMETEIFAEEEAETGKLTTNGNQTGNLRATDRGHPTATGKIDNNINEATTTLG